MEAESLEQETKDFLKRVTRMAKRDSSCCLFFPSASHSVTAEKLLLTATDKEEKEEDEEEESGGWCCSWSVVRMRMVSSEGGVIDEEKWEVGVGECRT